MLKIARYALFAVGLVLLPILASAEDSTVKRPQDIVYKSPYVGYPEVRRHVEAGNLRPTRQIRAGFQGHAALAS